MGAASLADVLYAADPDQQLANGEQAARDHYRAVADRVMESRRQRGMFASPDDLASIEGLSAPAQSVLRERTGLGTFSVVSAENVGPTIGRELRTRGVLAVVLSLLGMMAYIWWRFEFRFGVGAMIASAHDVIVTLGLYALLGYEFNLTTIAAFLTLVGYSVNDKIVSFDRVRENLRKSHSGDVVALLNRSLNQMLSRTLLTGGTTIMATAMLWLFGGDAIRGFSFIILVGVIVGTYSSIYIASPFALLWEQWFGGRGKREDAKPKSKAKPAAPAARTSASR
jgi:preprotein translocase subunit SecF